MYILGISAYYHDSAACLFRNGTLLGAAEEERFTGIKGDKSFPKKTIDWLLKSNGIVGKGTILRIPLQKTLTLYG